VIVTGSPAPTVEWFLDGKSTGQTGTSLTISNAGQDATGSYTAVASNAEGNETSTAAVLTVVADSGLTGLSSGDLGAPGVAVSRELPGGPWQQATNASGPDTSSSSDAADQLIYDFQSITGDFEATIHLQGLNGGPDARAGLMLREDANSDGSPDPGDVFVFLGTKSGSSIGYVQQVRATTGEAAEVEVETLQGSAAIGDTFPAKWVMLKRTGNNVDLYTSSDGTTFDVVDLNYAFGTLSDPVLVGLATWSGDSTVAEAAFDAFNVTDTSLSANIVDEPDFEGLVRTGDGSNDADFEYNTSTTYESDAGLGWMRPQGCKWNYVVSGTDGYASADDSGAKILCQVIDDGRVSTGLHTLRYKATNDGAADNTLIVRVYGINGAFAYGNWSDSFSTGSGTLLNSGADVADSSFANEIVFEETGIDLGTGYDYLLISIETGGVASGESMTIDDFQLFSE